MSLRKLARQTSVALAALSLASAASAVAVTWTDWTSLTNTQGSRVAQGMMGGVAVTVTATAAFGPMNQLQGPGANCTNPTRGNANYNYWQEPNAADKPYTGGTVSNAPTACEQISLNAANDITIAFTGGPVQSLYMALLSVGQGGIAVTYDFDQAFTIDSEGQGVWGNDGTDGIHDTVNHALTMREFHGMLRFNAPVTSLSFTTRPGENWHAFTLGMGPNQIPEPGSLALAGAALLLAGGAARRRRAA